MLCPNLKEVLLSFLLKYDFLKKTSNKIKYPNHHFAIRAISVFRVNFNVEFTRQEVNFSIVSNTPISCNTVGRDLLCSLLCPETDCDIHVGTQGYLFILTVILRGDDLMCHSLHQSASGIILKPREVDFFK